MPGVPEDAIGHGKNAKFNTEVVQNGDEFTWSQIYPCHTTTNQFTVGKESEIEMLNCEKAKITAKIEGGKLIMKFPNYIHTVEIEGDKLIETSVSGNITLKRVHMKTA
ncbi:gastrotropin-like isoform X3 [Mobula hypostoma]|uniref:gastrotropin-like isoform X3 n=1 Tax=Mobula hypostoma TaxID=723540 RepID=UPI002FC29335